jgi:membrane associated rhomboid family serine protease
MTSSSGVPVTGPETSEETYCYLHPDTPTKLRCTRCDRPICGRCAIPASVGQHCPNCVAEARRSAPKVRSALRATAPVVMTILIVNVVMWVIQTAAPSEPRTPYDIVTWALGAIPERIAAGEWYRLITPMFLHAPDMIWHIGFNSYALFIFGPNMEQALGRRRFLLLYLLAGFTGSALSYAFASCGQVGVGASGAIFGVLGGLLVFLYNRRRSTFVRQYMRNIILLIGVNLVFGFVFPGIDNFAHIGGLVGGAAIGLSLDEAPGGTLSPANRFLGVTAVVVAAVVLVAWRTATFSC